jgi:hypothetical protein
MRQQGLKPASCCGLVGTTEVVPCYKRLGNGCLKRYAMRFELFEILITIDIRRHLSTMASTLFDIGD